jgi:hypothetical protein
MDASPLCRSPDSISAIHDDASDEIRVSRIPTSLLRSYSSPLSTTSSSLSFTPVSTFWSGTKKDDEEVRATAMILLVEFWFRSAIFCSRLDESSELA